MTNNKRIEEVKNMMFFLNMKDNWTSKDFDRMRQLEKELKELEKNS